MEDPDQLRMEIPILLVPLIPTQGSVPQLIDAFTKQGSGIQHGKLAQA
jgi:hypothetical protein